MLTSTLTVDEDYYLPYDDSEYTPDMDWQMQIGEYARSEGMGPGCPLAQYARTHL